MRIVPTELAGVVIVEPKVFGDERGFFYESFSHKVLLGAGIDLPWVQDNHSRSAKGVLRGLHFQKGASAQDKLVRVTAGRVFDVAVDIRRSSPTFGRWVGVELSAANKRQLLIPKGFAHGFVSLEDGTEFLYKCSNYYDPANEGGVAWNDPSVGIAWPLGGIEPQLSGRDRLWPRLDAIDAKDLFP